MGRYNPTETVILNDLNPPGTVLRTRLPQEATEADPPNLLHGHLLRRGQHPPTLAFPDQVETTKNVHGIIGPFRTRPRRKGR